MRELAAIDMTGSECRYLEILTDAGIVRVNVGLVTTREARPNVTVEIEPNTSYARKTAPGGVWGMKVRDTFGGGRTDVSLTRQDVPQTAEAGS